MAETKVLPADRHSLALRGMYANIHTISSFPGLILGTFIVGLALGWMFSTKRDLHRRFPLFGVQLETKLVWEAGATT